MPVEATIPLNPPVNPIEQFGKIAAVQGQINQNRLFPLQMQAAQLANQQAQVGIATSQQALAASQVKAAQAFVGSLGQGATHDSVVNGLLMLRDTGTLDPKTAATLAATIPSDPTQFHDWALRSPIGQLAALGPAESLKAQQPVPQMVNTGGQMQAIQAPQIGPNGATPTPQIVGSTPMTFTPQERAAGITVLGPQNQPQRSSVGEQYDDTGNRREGAGPITTGLAPGVGEAQTAAATQSAAQWADLQRDTGGSASRIFALGKALKGLQGSNTGPGTETTNNIASFLQSQTPEALRQFLPGVDPNKIANYDEAVKYLTQYATGIAGSVGNGTDARLAATLTGNASTHISSLAAQDVVKAAIGLERMKQAQALEFQHTGQNAGQFASWATRWNTQTDPRAFMLDELTAAQRKRLLDGIPAAERPKFMASVRTAIRNGFYNEADVTK